MDTSRARARSKALLGNSYRAEIAAAIALMHGQPFHAQGVADDTGIRYPRVQAELRHLYEVGMIRDSPSDSRRVEYKAEPSSYWEACSALVKEWEKG